MNITCYADDTIIPDEIIDPFQRLVNKINEVMNILYKQTNQGIKSKEQKQCRQRLKMKAWSLLANINTLEFC